MNRSTIRPVRLRHRAIALIIAVILLSQTTLAAPESLLVVSNGVGGMYQSLNHAISAGSFSLSFLPIDSVKAWLKKLGKKKQTLDRIVIRPTNEDGTFSAMQDEKVIFSATAIADGQPIGGVDFKWTVQDSAQKHQAKRLNAGIFQAKHPGIYVLTAAADNGQQGSITVNVYPDEGAGIRKLLSKKDEDRTDKEKQGIQSMFTNGHLTSRSVSSRTIYNERVERQFYEIDKAKRAAVKLEQDKKRQAKPDPLATETADTASDTSTARKGGPSESDIEAAPERIGKRAMRRPADDDGWNGVNFLTADDPSNATGHPNASAPDAGAGNGDFQINAPVLSLAGRGIDVNLALVYNSRLWSKSGSTMSYDSDKGWPAPGWSLGFGKMMYMGAGGCMVVTPDGTRRSWDDNAMPVTYTYGSYYYASYNRHSTDGSFVDYTCSYSSSTYGQTLGGSASLPDGTTITYGSPDVAYDQVYPTQITDAQGNYINITYVGGQGPKIDTISDTLGRTISFTYNGSGQLASISAPAIGSGTRTLIDLNYTTVSLSGTFDGSITTTDVPGGTTQPALASIYYPDTHTGYWFGDADSYSTFGMIQKVVQQRGIASSGASGTMTDQKVYNFSTTSPSDAPTYSTCSETWDNMDITGPAVTGYVVSPTPAPSPTPGDQVITVTLPDGTVNKQTSHIDPGNPDDGFYFQGEIDASSTGPMLSKTKTYFGTGDLGTSRPTKTEVTDERGNVVTTDFLYASSSHNQLITKKEYGYTGSTLYRQTNNTYETDSGYASRHIFNLLKSTEVDNASGTPLTRTDYEHDNYTSYPLVAATGVVHHSDTSDPYTTDTHEEQGSCLMWNYDGCDWEGEELYIDNYGDYGYFVNCDCQEWDTFEVSNYDYTSWRRGNLTKITTYPDATTAPSGGIPYDFSYDITGNQRTATTNCCQQMSFDYTMTTQFSQPETHTKGSSSTSSSLRMSETAVYDFNTGVQTSSTDFNGLTTTTAYDTASLRPNLVTAPTGATTAMSYDDANLTEETTSKLSDGTTIVSKSSQTVNGRGKPRYSKYLAGTSNWNATSVKYDAMGRKWQTSMPYDSASSPSYWTVFAYDNLSRLVQTTAPDGSTSTTAYNETARPDSALTPSSSYQGQTVRSRDAWGRERWARTDAFGRLVEVVEPNPTGNALVVADGTTPATPTTLETKYDYDPLDELTTVTQGTGTGGQTRSFKYDSLGRLTRQKLAEQTATIDDAGCYFDGSVCSTGTPVWSEAFEYDSRSNVTKRTDARGAVATYSYDISGSPDPLNRLQSITYSLPTNHEATYAIDSAPPVSISYATSGDQTRVASVTTSGISTETNGYDSDGRISSYTLTMATRSSYPFVTDYTYDSANRLTQVTYPGQYGTTGNPRHSVAPSYDQASRLMQMNVNSAAQLSNVSYNASSQVTGIRVGNTSSGYFVYDEGYDYDGQTGLLTSQNVHQLYTGTTTPLDLGAIMDLSYGYGRGSSSGTTLSGKTGQLTTIANNLDHNKDRLYEFDAIGRLKDAKGGTDAGATGVAAHWTQSYSYDRYGNKTGVTVGGTDQTADHVAVPTDGLGSVGYDSSTNRVSGWTYDDVGNLIRGQDANGVWQKFVYDTAGRVTKVMDDSWNIFEVYIYGATRERLVTGTPSGRTYYCWGGNSVTQEYTEPTSGTTPTYSKAYFYAGSRLLMSDTGGTTNFYHPDRLGTKLITSNGYVSPVEQSTLPFGTELFGEESGSSSFNQKFTTYDRSAGTGLDYADNRTYSKGQSRFTQIDPLGVESITADPQSENLYAFVSNAPTDFVDPSGLLKEGPGSRGGGGESYDPSQCYVLEIDGMEVGHIGNCGGGPGGNFDPGGGGPGGSTVDECDHLLPSNIPEGFSVDANMKTAADVLKDIRKSAHAFAGDLGGRAAEGPGVAVETLLTFAQMMQNAGQGGKYDPRGQTNDERYGPIGNFNYGAMGTVMEFTEGQLLRVAGYQRQNGGKDPERGRGVPPASLNAVLGLGGTDPFGNIPEAEEDIKRGIAYAHCRGYR